MQIYASDVESLDCASHSLTYHVELKFYREWLKHSDIASYDMFLGKISVIAMKVQHSATSEQGLWVLEWAVCSEFSKLVLAMVLVRRGSGSCTSERVWRRRPYYNFALHNDIIILGPGGGLKNCVNERYS